MVNAEVDICNLALSYLGDEATVTSVFPPEGSVQARMCAGAYPYALQSLLEESDWTFASKQVELARLAGKQTDGWRYAYALPSDCLRVRTVRCLSRPMRALPLGLTFAPNQAATTDVDYAVGISGDVRAVLTDSPSVLVRYTANIRNTDLMSAHFKLALSYRLASMIAGKRIGGVEGARYAQFFKKEEEQALTKAKNFDASQRVGARLVVPSWIEGR